MASVLVVDDDTIVRSIVAQFLKFGGHSTIEAASAEEALDILAESRPDLVLTDLSMPGMSGLELRTVGRQIASGTPFILMSGHIIDDRIRMEFDDVLEKPLGPTVVLKAVERLAPQEQAVA